MKQRKDFSEGTGGTELYDLNGVNNAKTCRADHKMQTQLMR